MKILPLFCAVLLFALPAVADDGCYSKAEVDAEQVLRLHSELMVITVTCKYGSQGQSLVGAYTEFTRKNISLIRKAEQIMKKYYSVKYGGDGLSRLDSLRTRLGNEFGQRIADVSAPVFCEQYRDKVMLMSAYRPRQLAEELEDMKEYSLTYAPECGKSAKLARRK